MYPRLYLPLLLLWTVSSLHAQNLPVELRSRMVDVSDDSDYVRGATATADGGTIVAGMLQGPTRAYVMRLDHSGTIRWIKLIEGTIYQTADYVVELPDGTILVVGQGYDQLNGSYRQAPLLFKLDADGNLLWSKQLHAPYTHENMYAWNFQAGGDDYCYISGYLIRNDNGGSEQYDQFLININEEGDLEWGNILVKSDRYYLPTKVVPLSEGGIKIFGIVDYDFDVFNKNIEGIFVAEIDSAGVFLQGVNLVSQGGHTLETAIHHQRIIDVRTENYIGGWVNFSDSSTDSSYAFVAKFNDEFEPLWIKSYHDPVARIVEGADEIMPLNNGNLLINLVDKSGYQAYDLSPDPNEDIVLAELTPQGGVVSTRRVGTAAREENNRLALHANGSIDVATTGRYLNDELRGERNVLLTHFGSYHGTGPACLDSTLTIDLEVSDLPVEVSPMTIEMIPYDSITLVNLVAYDAPDVIVRPVCEDCPADVRARAVASSAPCDTDSLALEVQLCNYGCQPLPTGLPYTLYTSDPRQTTAVVVHSDTLPLALPPTMCRRVRLPVLPTGDYFLVANDAGQSITPFDPGQALVDSSRLEGNYANNVVPLRGPVSYVLTDSLQLCYGDTVRLAAQWISTAGTYTFHGSSQLGCDSLHTYVVEVRDSLRSTLRIAPYVSIDQAGAVTVDSLGGGGGGPYTVTWDDGYTGAYRDGLVPGAYTLTVTSALGCAQSLVVRVELGTATTTVATRSYLSAYPNPVAAGSTLVVRQSGNLPARNYEFVDVHGRVVATRTATPRSVGNGVALAAPAQSGLYLLRPIERTGRSPGAALRVVVQ